MNTYSYKIIPAGFTKEGISRYGYEILKNGEVIRYNVVETSGKAIEMAMEIVRVLEAMNG